jgi:hypothetical protein
MDPAVHGHWLQVPGNFNEELLRRFRKWEHSGDQFDVKQRIDIAPA